MISVILPAYNERENLPKLIAEIETALGDQPHEVLVVDDNSPDGTKDLIQSLALPSTRIVPRSGPRGLAASIWDGIQASQGKIVVIMDSDFNHSPKYIPFMVANLAFYDCVSGSRFLYGGSMDSQIRYISSWVFNIFTRVATRGAITDSLYGFLAIHRSVLDQCPPEKIFWGYGDYCIRLMFYLQKMNRSVLQFPVINGRRLHGQANSRLFKVLAQYTTEVFRLVLAERIFLNGSRNSKLPDMRQPSSSGNTRPRKPSAIGAFPARRREGGPRAPDAHQM